MSAGYLFVGDGEYRARQLRLWLVEHEPRGLAKQLATWSTSGKTRTLDRITAFQAKEAPDDLHKRLAQLHRHSPLALVVRTGTCKPAPRHFADAAEPRLFATLHELLASSQPYLKPVTLAARTRSRDPVHSISTSMIAQIAGQAPHAELVLATLDTLRRTFVGDHKPVLLDLLLERLPPLLGHDFDADLVIREALANVQGIGVSTVAMPSAFDAAFAERTKQYGVASNPTREAPLDLSTVEAVRRGLASENNTVIADSFDENNEAHVAAMLALTPDELREVTTTGWGIATRLANAALQLMSRGDFAHALILYDAAVEGRLDAMAAANPLYAVQNDNNHLGVDEKRARRYLERCLPHGPNNPTIFLNASFVYVELGMHDEAIAMLTKAKQGSVDVTRYQNEALFVPLRSRADFKAVMRSRKR